jgi:hypothetical protein
MRRNLGWAGLAATIVLWGIFIVARTPQVWRLTLFIPAMLGMLGWLQSAWHFCAAFGFNGVFNFGANVGKTDTIEQAEYRKKDRKTAMQIVGLSLLSGVAVAVAGYFLPV